MVSFFHCFERLWLAFNKTFVLLRTFVSTVFWKQPSNRRPSVKHNLHFLRWISKPKFSVVGHVFKVCKIRFDHNSLWGTLSKITKLWLGKSILYLIQQIARQRHHFWWWGILIKRWCNINFKKILVLCCLINTNWMD